MEANIHPKYSAPIDDWQVCFCLICYHDLLDHMKSSIEIPIQTNKECNSFCHNVQTPYTVYSAKNVAAKIDDNHITWKFTNDSRRHIIRTIKKTFNIKLRNL